MAMDKRVFLIASKKSFMVNAMIKNMEAAGFSVTYALPAAKMFPNQTDLPKIVLFYLEDDVDQMAEALAFFKDVAKESNFAVKIFLIGSDSEIEAAGQLLTEAATTDIFHRPVNVKEIVERLNLLMDMPPAGSDAREEKNHILVVDDDGTMLRTLKLWLSDKYQVYMANSGQNAISLLAQHKVDLILLDYEMPVANGPQVLRMIREDEATKDIPVMFLTAKNDMESVVSKMDLKPEKYLLKTMPPDELMENIDSFFIDKGEKM